MKVRSWLGFAVAASLVGACATDQQGDGDESTGEVEQDVAGTGCTVSLSATEAAVTFGQQVHLTAVASCPGGATADVQFLEKNPNGAFVSFQNFGTGTTAAFTTNAVGTNQFEAKVRTHGTTETPAVSNIVSVPVADTVPSCTAVKLTAPAGGTTFPGGAPVPVTGTATCPQQGEVQFWAKGPGSTDFAPVTAYTTGGSSSFVPGAAGDFQVKAMARVVGAHVTYQVASSSVTIHIQSAPVNQPPVANADSQSTRHDTATTFDPRANDTDADGDSLTIVGAGSAGHGSTSFTGTSVTYTPAAGFAGSDSFNYTIDDGHGHQATGSVSMSVTNNAPVANDDSASTNIGSAVTIDPRGNDSDLDSDALTVVGVGSAANGTTSFTGTSVTYTPGTNFAGSDSFTYQVSDGIATSTATVSVTVNDRPPVAVDDSASTNENTPVAINVLANDSDPDPGDSLTVVGASSPSGGSLSLDANQNLVYTPFPGFAGNDSFLYEIEDSHGAFAIAQVLVTVVDRAPTANADSVSTQSNSAVTFDPRGNDTDPDGDALSIVGVGSAGAGSVSFTATSVTYTPNTNFVGTDSFSYTISDGHTTALGSITVTVNNQAPTANADSVSTPVNTAVTFDPTANDSDPDGGTLSVIGAGSGAAHGSVSVAGNNVTYTPANGFAGSDAFGYTISDGQGGTASGTVSVTVTNVASSCTVSISSQESSVIFGNSIHLDATASCTTGPAQIQWLKKVGTGSNQTVVPFGDNNAHIVLTAQDVGDNQFTAQVRTKGTTPVQATSNTVHVNVADNVPSCTAVKVTSPSPGSTVAANTPVTLTGVATCPVGVTPEYQFWVKTTNTPVWTILPAFTTGSSSFSFPTSPTGQWNVTVVARAVGAHTSFQVRANSITVNVQ